MLKISNKEIKEYLFSTKSAKRKKAVKVIVREKLVDLSDSLFAAYLNEKKDLRTWETQVEMILAFGLLNFKKALPEIEEIINLNKNHDMIAYSAAQSYVRLKRKSINDAEPVIELLKFGGLSLVDGALNPLGYDRMNPPKDEIIELIKFSWDLHMHKDRIGKENNFCDPRYGLVAACAGWDIQLTKDFLNHVLKTYGNDLSLKILAENSLKGKYSKLR